MWRNVIIAAAALLGSVVLFAGYVEMRAQPAGAAVADATEMAEAAEVVELMRVCLGPARVTFGGEPFVGLAFGGDGCSTNAANLVGFRILRKPSLPAGLPDAPTLTDLLPL